MIASLEQFGVDEKSGNENITNTAYRYTYNVAAQLDYTRTFNRMQPVSDAFGQRLATSD